jgi:hypothetical protein
MPMKKRRKRTGDIGPLHVMNSPDGPSIEWEKIEFPTSKEDIEYFFAQRFREAYNESPLLPELLPHVDKVLRNPQNSLDVRLKTVCGEMWLDLMSIKPIEYHGVHPDQAPSTYNAYDIAQFIHGKIMDKSRDYLSAKPGKEFLLLYLDDWRFQPSDAMITLLKYFCNQKAHLFKAIFYYMPSDATSGHVSVIFPTPSDIWTTFDPEQYRRGVINLDPAKWLILRTPPD